MSKNNEWVGRVVQSIKIFCLISTQNYFVVGQIKVFPQVLSIEYWMGLYKHCTQISVQYVGYNSNNKSVIVNYSCVQTESEKCVYCVD